MLFYDAYHYSFCSRTSPVMSARPLLVNGWRYMALGAPYEDPVYVAKFYAKRDIQVAVFGTAASLRDAVRITMVQRPDLLCVVQNPPEEGDTTLPLGSIATVQYQ